MKVRLDNLLVKRELVASRSQAESYIAMGKVFWSRNGKAWKPAQKSGEFVDEDVLTKVEVDEQFVSRAALKLKSVAEKLHVDFRGKTVLDIGSSTGGFTEFALTRGAKKVIAVDVGTNQLHPKLRRGKWAKKIELHEKTDIRKVYVASCHPELVSGSRKNSGMDSEYRAKQVSCRFQDDSKPVFLRDKIDLILADVSFISLREILPHVAKNLANRDTQIVAMVKPQFETGFSAHYKNHGVIKNEKERREILREFEAWSRKYFVIIDKKDSEVAGAKGNRERFYLLKKVKND